MDEILLKKVGYVIDGSANLIDWNGKECEIDLTPSFVNEDEYSESNIKLSIPTIYRTVESATINIYACYQSRISGQIVSAKIFIKTLNI